MKERKTRWLAGQKQMIVASCMMLILVTCLTGLFIARKMEQKRMDADLAKNSEKLSEDVDTEPLQEVDSVVLPEVKKEEPKVLPKEEPVESNKPEADKEEVPVKDSAAEPVGGSAVQVKEEAEPVAAPQFSGKLQWPVEGNVLMNYSMDSSIYFATLDQYKYNPAMIISAKEGDAVAAAAGGEIVKIKKDAQSGLTVQMDIGDGYTVIYGQLQDLNFKEGARLEAGDVIGTIAAPTKYYSLEGTNLFFELMKDKEPVNPMDFLPESGVAED